MTLDEFVSSNRILSIAGERILEVEAKYKTAVGTIDHAVRKITGLIKDLESSEQEVERLQKVQRVLVRDLNSARAQRNELDDHINRVEPAVADEIEHLRRKVKLLTFSVEARDATFMDVTHDLAYSYEARNNVVWEKADLAATFDDYRRQYLQARHDQKLNIRALADMARNAVYGGSQSLQGKISTLQQLVERLDKAWRNA